MTATYSGLTANIDEMLRKPEVDALIVNISKAQTHGEVALLLAHFLSYAGVTVATQDRLRAITAAQSPQVEPVDLGQYG